MHLQADCLCTGISSGPNARYRVWEAFTRTGPPLREVATTSCFNRQHGRFVRVRGQAARPRCWDTNFDAVGRSLKKPPEVATPSERHFESLLQVLVLTPVLGTTLRSVHHMAETGMNLISHMSGTCWTIVAHRLGQPVGWVGFSRVKIFSRLVGLWVSVGRLQKIKALYLSIS